MKRPITFISTISILLFIIALVWAGLGIYTDRNKVNEENAAKFETLLLKTRTAVSECKTETPEFSRRFIKAIDNIDDFSVLQLKVNGKLLYSYPPANFQNPSKGLVKTYQDSILMQNGTKIELQASMFTIRTNSIYRHGRLAFILILAGTLISVFLIITLKDSGSDEIHPFSVNPAKKIRKTLSNKSKEHHTDDIFEDELFAGLKESTLPEETSEADDNTDYTDEKDSQKPSQGVLIETKQAEAYLPKKFEIPVENHEESLEDYEIFNEDPVQNEYEENYEISLDEENTYFDDSLLARPSDSASEDETESEINSEEQNKEENDHQMEFDFDAPVPAYSPVTGLKVQSSLNEELQDSIDRTLKNNSDLTFAILKINGLDRGNLISNKLINLIKEEFESGTEMYEYNSDSYAIIVNDLNLNSCVDIFDKIYQSTTDFLKENEDNHEVTIGLSSVTGRQVSADRLKTEADQALAHAISDPDSPIIAFRANPSKFKEFMDSQ